jgi:hypothetical protein
MEIWPTMKKLRKNSQLEKAKKSNDKNISNRGIKKNVEFFSEDDQHVTHSINSLLT